MLPEAKKREIDQACQTWYVEAPPGPSEPPPEPCASLLEDAVRPVKSIAGDTYDMGGGYFLYDACGTDLAGGRGRPEHLLALDPRTGLPSNVPPRTLEAVPVRAAVDSRGGGAEFANSAGEYACGQENAAAIWLNLPAVQSALHVRLVGKERFDFSTPLRYNFTAHSLLDSYKAVLAPHYRILQFSGDADPCVPYVGTARWVESLSLPVSSPWRPWTAAGTMPVTGYVTAYNNSRFTFATVRDAGHMVPRYKPAQALWMMSKWLSGQPL